jgi:hypothetical protein
LPHRSERGIFAPRDKAALNSIATGRDDRKPIDADPTDSKLRRGIPLFGTGNDATLRNKIDPPY